MNGSTVTKKSNGSVQQDLGWCHYIPWDSNFIQHILPDPTRIFVILCCTIMYFRYVQAHEYNFILGIQNFFLHPYVILYVGSAVLTYYIAIQHRNKKRLGSNNNYSIPIYDQWIIEWYFWNGCLFHAIMDGSSGSLRLIPVVVHQYDILDNRFTTLHTVPYVIGMVELMIMYPLCLLTMYYMIVDHKHPYRFPLELVTSTFHIMGMIVFVACEVYDGQCNIPALDPVGQNCNFNEWEQHTLNWKFNLYHLTYYWFGFWFCNLIWGIVPFYRIIRSIQECHRAFQLAAITTTTTTTTIKKDS